MEKEYELIDNWLKRQFELNIDGLIPIIKYVRNKNRVYYLTHTRVPAELEGKGVGKELVEKTLLYIKQHNGRVVPLCSFVAAYIKRHPEWEEIVAF